MFSWNDPENARFLNKHVVVVGNNPTLQSMVDIGTDIFAKRVRASARPDNRIAGDKEAIKALKDDYGAGFKSTFANTLVVLTISSQQKLEALIKDRNCANGQYTLDTGVFFMCYSSQVQIGITATLGLKFLANKLSTGKHLDHLNTPTEPQPTVITTQLLKTTDRAFMAQRIVSHSSTPESTRLAPSAPSPAQLIEAKNRLKKIPTGDLGLG